jgi:hypothetical protein
MSFSQSVHALYSCALTALASACEHGRSKLKTVGYIAAP